MKKLLSIFLTVLAKIHLWRYKPQIVAVTGNAGKTSTKEAIAAVLRNKYRVRATAGNMNTELGVPATIIGDFSDEYSTGGGTAMFWLGVIIKGLAGIFYSADYPEILVLEYGADKPGDIRRLAGSFHPHVAVVTQVGEIPVHVEFFASAKHLAEEKSNLIKVLRSGDHAVLNNDDLTVSEMAKATPSAVIHHFGFGVGADVQIGELEVVFQNSKPSGIGFNLKYDGAIMPVVIRGTLGRGVAMASAAAAVVGQIFGVGLADASEALSEMKTPAGRMRILNGVKDTVIIDDTYNASPSAMHLALDTLKGLSGRKVAVLGDMLELGSHTVHAHQGVGTIAAGIADVLVCVGARGKIIFDAAGNQMASDKIFWFENSSIAAKEIQKIIQPGDTVLVKGSQGVRMERVVKEILAETEKARELLVRQSTTWLNK